MIKRILILEDNQERQIQFQNNLTGFEKLVIVDQANKAISYLRRNNWDVLFLDHDLGGEINVSENERNTGSEVARWLVSHPERKPRLIIIHSLNIIGQKYIKGMLSESVILPFAWKILTSSNLTEENILELQKLSERQNLSYN